MHLYAYQATERGIQQRNSAVFSEERSRVMAAQREAWEMEQAEKEAIRLRRLESEARRMAMQAELRAAGMAKHVPYHSIEDRAMRVFKVTRKEIRSNRRCQAIVIVRQFISYWAVRLTNLSLPQIGRLMGGFDHTTILHHKRRYPERRAKMGRYLRPTR